MLKLEQIPALASLYGVPWTNRAVGLVMAGMFGGTFFGATKILGIGDWRVAVGLFIIGFACGYVVWLMSCRIPKNKPGMIGIALAIKAETLEEHRRIRADFIQEIATCLGANGAASPFHVLEIPGYLAPDVNDIEGAAEFLAKSRSHLLIWGSIRTRSKARAPTYCLRLEGAITHTMIEQQRSQAFAKDVRLAIPAKTEISLANELRGFESTSQSISFGSQYVVAMAAAISGDWAFSKSLLLELSDKLGKPRSAKTPKGKTSRKSSDTLAQLRTLVPVRIGEVCFAHYHSSILEWQKYKSDLAPLERAEESLEIYRKSLGKKENPSYWTNKAMLDVTLREDIESAGWLLNKCRAAAIDDPTWRLSLAFVNVLKGNVMEAINLYDAALERAVQTDTLMNIEDYVQWWLKVHNGPPALYLLSALLNARGKGDGSLALADLNAFEAAAGNIDAKITKRAVALRNELDLVELSRRKMD